MLKIKVKVGNVTNLSDARYCAGMGVDLLGFPVGSHDGIDPEKYKEITDWVSVPGFVLEWVGNDFPRDFEEHIQSYNASFLQVNARLIANIPATTIPLIVTLAASDWSVFQPVLRSIKDRIAYLILQGPENGTFDKSIITEIASEFPVLLGFGLSQNNLDVLSTLAIAGISLEGTEESKPGLKDYSHLSDILERLEVNED